MKDDTYIKEDTETRSKKVDFLSTDPMDGASQQYSEFFLQQVPLGVLGLVQFESPDEKSLLNERWASVGHMRNRTVCKYVR